MPEQSTRLLNYSTFFEQCHWNALPDEGLVPNFQAFLQQIQTRF